MHDPWTDRLSEYMDGEMDAAEASRLEEHLASCDACTDALAGLADVVAAAHALEDRPPATDLWPGIAAALEGGARPAAGAGPQPVARDVVDINSRRTRTARSFTFSMPQLAAAAMLLMAVSAGAAWLVVGGNGSDNGGAAVMAEGTIFQSVNPPSPTSRLVDTRPADAEVSASLVQLLDEARESLDPATVEVLERSIASIEEAISAAEAALAADPGNPRLQRQLDSTLQRRDEFAQRVTRVQRGGA